MSQKLLKTYFYYKITQPKAHDFSPYRKIANNLLSLFEMFIFLNKFTV